MARMSPVMGRNIPEEEIASTKALGLERSLTHSRNRRKSSVLRGS